MSKQVDQEKLSCLGARNRLKSVTKSREQQQQQLQAVIAEKSVALERLKVQYEALRKQEQEQQEFIDQLILQQWAVLEEERMIFFVSS